MIQILLNGEAFEAEPASTVTDLLERLALVNKRVAVEVNQELVPRSVHAEHVLNEGDKVEIVHAIGGG